MKPPPGITIARNPGADTPTTAGFTVTFDLASHIDALITEAVETATSHYAEGRPGRGAFVLQRLALRLKRLDLNEETPQ